MPLLDEFHPPNVPLITGILRKTFGSLGNSFPIFRQHPIRRDLRKGNQHKGSFAQVWMGHGQTRKGDLRVSIQQQIQVYYAWTPPNGSDAAHLIFNVQKNMEQRLRRQTGPDSSDLIKKVRLVCDPDRCRFIERRDAYNRYCRQNRQFSQGLLDTGLPVSEVRA